MKGPEIGKLYMVSVTSMSAYVEFMAKLVQVRGETQDDVYNAEDVNISTSWRFDFDNNTTCRLSGMAFEEIKKWYFWDTKARRTVAEGDNVHVNPFSVLCTDCGGMLKPLTMMEVETLALPAYIEETCLECNDDPTQTISAQFDVETETLVRNSERFDERFNAEQG